MLNVFLGVCCGFLIVLLVQLTIMFMIVRRDYKVMIDHYLKRSTQIKRPSDEPTVIAPIQQREANPAKKNIGTVPEIDPSRFTAILKNPPRTPGGFGVVVKEDKDKGSQDQAGNN